jgi:radical SAM superfamily enzyme YgiQ (UPF0313 family)
MNGEDISARIGEVLEAFEPTVIGITAKLGNGARRFRAVVKELADRAAGVPIAAGGPLVSSFPDPGLPLWNSVRGLFWGDGEESFPTWVATGCPTTIWPRPAEVANLDSVGIPTWWDGLGEYVWPSDHWPGLAVRAVHVSAARGCTRRCTFCYLNTNYPTRSFRAVSPTRIVADLDRLAARWGVEGFYFVDDCLISPASRHTGHLVALLTSRGSPYRLGCDLQLHELADIPFLRSVYEAGFRSFYVGVEAASAATRRRLGKGRLAADPHTVLRRALDAGFTLRASIGIGWPGESVAQVLETIALIEQLPDLMFDAFRYTPLPLVPLTKHWGAKFKGTGRDGAADIYEDYSEFSRNHSHIADEVIDELWSRMLALEAERRARYWS